MGRFYYVSDLHVDINKDFNLLESLPDGNVDFIPLVDNLIIAGDLITNWNPALVISFLKQCKSKFKNVIYILGNHEYYKSPHAGINATIKAYENICQETDVILLTKNTPLITIDGINIIGVTLWANAYRHGKPLEYTNDIYMIPKYSVEAFCQEHLNDLNVLTNLISLQKEPCIVVTHFSPLGQNSLAKKYHGSPANVFYYTPLYDLIKTLPDKSYWIFGHTHHNITEVIDSESVNINKKSVTVTNNCYGYDHECKDFTLSKYIEF
jgi:hypothetical protein